MLRAVQRASAGAIALASALFLLVLFVRPLPAELAWPAAYAVVTLLLAGIGTLGWSVLTLPKGAPWRTKGLRIGGVVIGVIIVAALIR